MTSRERIYHDALKRIATAESGIWGRIAATAIEEGQDGGVVVARGTDALLSTGGQPSDDFHGATE